MRKIISKHVEERRQKRNQVIIGLTLIFLMFFSVVGYAFSFLGGNSGGVSTTGNANTINYNGFEFTYQNGFWILNLNNVNFIFRHSPHEIPNIQNSVKTIDNYIGKKLYVYSKNIGAESEIVNNMIGFVSSIEKACLEGEECSENLQVKTCEENFIIIKNSESSEIVQENNCVFINGKSEDLTKLTDRFLLKVLEIDN